MISPMFLTTGKISPFVQLLISHQQFGFVEGLSTLKQLLKFLADIHHHAENKHCTDVIYFDLNGIRHCCTQQLVLQALDAGEYRTIMALV